MGRQRVSLPSYLKDVRERVAREFLEFSHLHPEILLSLNELAREFRHHNPGAKLSISLLVERLRWEYMTRLKKMGLHTRINNNHRSCYARVLNRQDGLEGMFIVRSHRIPHAQE